MNKPITRSTINANMLKILEVFLDAPDTPLVGVDIAIETGLAQSTVSQVLAALREAGWLVRTRQTDTTPQSPWKPYVLHEDTRLWLSHARGDIARLTGASR